MTTANSAASGGTGTAASSARRLADHIDRLPGVLTASFALTNAQERVARLRGIASQILVDLAPVMSWLECKKHPQTADLVYRRVNFVVEEAAACGQEIPEYAGGHLPERRTGKPSSAGAKRAAALPVTSRLVARSLRDWAKEIEAQDAEVGTAVLHEDLVAIRRDLKSGPQSGKHRNPRPKRKRGGQQKYDSKADKRIAEAARANGTVKAAAIALGIAAKDVQLAVWRYQYHQRGRRKGKG